MIPNYTRAVMESINTLQLGGLIQAPIDLDQILDSVKLTVKCCTYSQFAKENDFDIDEVCDFFDSELGAVAYLKQREKYVIYYNDTKNNRGLERFTIAHELGHIFLGHHKDANTDILLRNNISDKQYQVYEKEANCFARNLLSPGPLVERITDIKSESSINDIMGAFEVSFSAAMVRRKFYVLDKHRMNLDYYDYFNNYNIRYDYYCLNCDNTEINISGFCKICGEKANFFERSNHGINYSGIELDQNKRVVQCPKCCNEVHSEQAKFCKICGTLLYNLCNGIKVYDPFGNIVEYIDHINDGNARFCAECGSKTTFYKQEFLKDWKELSKVRYGEANPLHEAVAEKKATKY